jgi:hypothetical protein
LFDDAHALSLQSNGIKATGSANAVEERSITQQRQDLYFDRDTGLTPQTLASLTQQEFVIESIGSPIKIENDTEPSSEDPKTTIAIGLRRLRVINQLFSPDKSN